MALFIWWNISNFYLTLWLPCCISSQTWIMHLGSTKGSCCESWITWAPNIVLFPIVLQQDVFLLETRISGNSMTHFLPMGPEIFLLEIIISHFRKFSDPFSAYGTKRKKKGVSTSLSECSLSFQFNGIMMVFSCGSIPLFEHQNLNNWKVHANGDGEKKSFQHIMYVTIPNSTLWLLNTYIPSLEEIAPYTQY